MAIESLFCECLWNDSNCNLGSNYQSDNWFVINEYL